MWRRRSGRGGRVRRGGVPTRPFLLGPPRGRARPREADPPHPDAVADRLAVAHHVIEPSLSRVDDDRARAVIAGEADHGLGDGSVAAEQAAARGAEKAAARPTAAEALVVGLRTHR